ncbi:MULTISPECIES: hypothetical protein [unclassified Streptomyces]|uniref:hypothetical protein n=1 Tax=unclassified Streptomyces TaxID=2593676 RepID=UPI00225804A0|nr:MULTISPECIES: hypothetical protein [unclassified Streptomyces]MCX4871080.1 hypothetical protein [Streptomyces sp. NBC_00906]MCX4902692.1 hypothetical protein [Streptomyces sp. NBC_00892]
MSTTTYWTWTVAMDEPGTGQRIEVQGEAIAPLDATGESVLEHLYPGLNEELRARYGAGYVVENLAPACRIKRK